MDRSESFVDGITQLFEKIIGLIARRGKCVALIQDRSIDRFDESGFRDVEMLHSINKHMLAVLQLLLNKSSGHVLMQTLEQRCARRDHADADGNSSGTIILNRGERYEFSRVRWDDLVQKLNGWRCALQHCVNVTKLKRIGAKCADDIRSSKPCILSIVNLLVNQFGRSQPCPGQVGLTRLATTRSGDPDSSDQCSNSTNSRNPIRPFRHAHFRPRDSGAYKVQNFNNNCNSANCCDKSPFCAQGFIGSCQRLPVYKFFRNHYFSSVNWQNRNTTSIGGGK